MTVQIVSNIPLPQSHVRTNKWTPILSSMKPGDSFTSGGKPSAWYPRFKKIADASFVVRTEGDGVRVWRKS